VKRVVMHGSVLIALLKPSDLGEKVTATCRYFSTISKKDLALVVLLISSWSYLVMRGNIITSSSTLVSG